MTETTSYSRAKHDTALRVRSGISDRSVNGRLWITGTDALDLLNRLSTNELEELPGGTGTSTVLTNGDARVIDLLDLGAIEQGFWCLTSPELAQTVVDWLDLYTFGEEITVVDLTAETFEIAVVGPAALETLIGAGASNEDLDVNQLRSTTIAGVNVLIWHKLAGGAEGYELIGNRDDALAIISSLKIAGGKVITQSEWEVYRIANGMPAAGTEFGLFNNPLEARLLGAISDTKGCYTGQEVIARLQTYQKVQHRLMSVDLTGPVEPGVQLFSQSTVAGRLTSVSQTDEGNIGLALVNGKFAEEDLMLDVSSDIQPPIRATLRNPFYAILTEPRGETT